MVNSFNKQHSTKSKRQLDSGIYNLLLLCEGSDEEGFLRIHQEKIKNIIMNKYTNYNYVEVKIISKDSSYSSKGAVDVTTSFLNTVESCIKGLENKQSDYIAYHKICFIYDTDVFKKFDKKQDQNKTKIRNNYFNANSKIEGFNVRNVTNSQSLPTLVRCISNPCLEIILLIGQNASLMKSHTSTKQVIKDYEKIFNLEYDKGCMKNKTNIWKSLDIEKILKNLKKHYQSHGLENIWLTTNDNYSELFKIVE